MPRDSTSKESSSSSPRRIRRTLVRYSRGWSAVAKRSPSCPAARVSSMTACNTVPDEALLAAVQAATREHRRDRRLLERLRPGPADAVDDAMPDRRMQAVGTHGPPSSSSVCRFKAGTSLDSSITLPWPVSHGPAHRGDWTACDCEARSPNPRARRRMAGAVRLRGAPVAVQES